MTIQKQWLNLVFSEGQVKIEVAINYETKQFNISDAHEDHRVRFDSEHSECIADVLTKSKLVSIALKYIKQELAL